MRNRRTFDSAAQACNLHSVVEKGIKGDLWGCFRIRLRPCDVEDERFGVFQVSYLLCIINIEDKTKKYSRVNPKSLPKVIK